MLVRHVHTHNVLLAPTQHPTSNTPQVETVFLSAAATLSSTAMVSEFVAHSRLGDTVFARMLIDLVSVQDLVM